MKQKVAVLNAEQTGFHTITVSVFLNAGERLSIGGTTLQKTIIKFPPWFKFWKDLEIVTEEIPVELEDCTVQFKILR